MGLPCGKCAECLSRRMSGWAFRLQKEMEHCDTALFVTLTYNTENIPIAENGKFTLKKRDIQLFFKRLRRICSRNLERRQTIKYYIVGEYGDQFNRPHYHAILFNATGLEIEQAWAIKKSTPSAKSISAKSLRRQSRTRSNTCAKILIPIQPFSLMSKGIGATYLTQKMKTWHHADLTNRMYIPIENGKKIAMPRYYKNKIYEAHEREQIAFKMQQKISQEKPLTELEKINLIKGKTQKFNRKNQKL